MFKSCFLAIGLLLLSSVSFAQNNQKMSLWQDSLLSLGTKMFSSNVETDRLESNFTFVKTLVSALKEANSYFFNFDKLQMISVLNAPDNSFRVFTWNLPLDDGSFLYYGTIQHKSGTIKLTPLLDKTFQIDNPETAITSNKNWYGAQYYEILTLAKGQYVLLGWKGHHATYSQRVIEVLNVAANGDVTFGAQVFSDKPEMTRKVFSFTKQATMFLKYNSLKKQIEFDHIVPADPSLEGNFKYYGPDLSHDGYSLERGRLIFKENIEVHNPERGDEDRYIDPTKPSRKLRSGL